MYFYEKGLKNYQYFIHKEEVISIEDDYFIYVANHDKKTFKKIDQYTNKIFNLEYKNIENFLNYFYNETNTISSHFKTIYTVDINGLALQFEVDKSNKITFYQDIQVFNFKELPEFIKEQYLSFKTKNDFYDIEWTGNNYQAQHYLFNVYFFNEDYKKVKQEIIEFENIIEDIPFEKEFYLNEGYEIIITENNNYVSYPYSYEIHNLKENSILKGSGIPNHFESKEQAYKKAVFKIWNIYFNEYYQTENKYILNKINEFISFFKKQAQ